MNAKLIEVKQETRDVKYMVFELDKDINFKYGQYIMFAFPDLPTDKRAFSIIDYDSSKRTISTGIKLHKKFTTRLFEMKIGESVLAFGPYGTFVVKPEFKKIVFIAGGIGIVPIYSMVLGILSKEDLHDYNVVIYYSSRERSETAFIKELENLSLNHNNISLKQWYTSEKKERISIDLIKKDIPDFKNWAYYICGIEEMNQYFIKKLSEEEILEEFIRSEQF